VSDVSWLEEKFRARPNEWLRMTDLIAWSQAERGHGLTVHSRIADLRNRGLTIEQQSVREWNGYTKSYSGRVTSYYRFVPLGAADHGGASAAPSGGEDHPVAQDPLPRPPGESPLHVAASSPLGSLGAPPLSLAGVRSDGAPSESGSAEPHRLGANGEVAALPVAPGGTPGPHAHGASALPEQTTLFEMEKKPAWA